ncbi:MAG: LCP family protein [Bacilli bacterium]|nr:LCP family protein [Bacilli bacterium]
MSKREKQPKKKKYRILTFLLLLVSLILIGSIMYINTLPMEYLGIILGIIIVIDIWLLFMMKFSKKRRTGAVLSFLITLIMGVISFYLLKTAGLIDNLNLNYKTYNYSVVVLKSSSYDKIGDIEDESLGYYKTDGNECAKSLKKISKKVKTINKEYEDVKTMGADLLNNKVEAILIEDSYLNILNEQSVDENKENDSIRGFVDDTKVIYKFTIIVKTSNISKDIDVTRKPFNIYISGIDTYGEISSVSRSDVNMIVTVNPNTKQILLTSIPRDYYVPLHGKSGYNDKLTHAGLYGVDMSIHTIEDLLDIDINYYVKVNFSSVIKIVDALGGVEVLSDYSFTSIDGYSYTKGYNKVNGEEALSFARERKAFAAGDNQRVKDQQALLEAMFRKCISPSIIVRYNSLIDSLSGSFVTNMPSDRLKSLVRLQMAKKYKWTITANSLDGENSSNYTYSYSASKLYVMEPIDESVKYAGELIKSVIDGEKLDPSFDGNASDVHKVTGGKRTNTTSTTTNENKTTNKELNVSLSRSKFTFSEGDTFIYHGYTATYDGKDVTNSTKATFSINGKTFDDYQDLVSYVSSLSPGQYNIVYKVTYNNQSKSLNQTVVVEEGYNTTTTIDDNTDTTTIIDNKEAEVIEEDNNN